jgi:glycosyltransferase involved in cell wall biosynthesis
VQAVIAGEGPMRSALEALIARSGLEESVRLLGHRPDIESVLEALDVFVQPSRSEGMSNTILEAMASGLPVVATHVGGADEMVVDGETGVLVPAHDAQALASALERLVISEALRQNMGAAGRNRVQLEFSLQAMIDGYRSFYCGLRSDRETTPTAGRRVR